MNEKEITIVLLPGLNGTDGLFQRLLDAMPCGVKALCISYPPHEEKSYRELAAYVLGEINKIEGEYLLIGESFSGPIAILISEENPKGLLGTILAATFISPPNVKVARFLPWQILFSLAKPLYTAKQWLKPKGTLASIFDSALIEVQKSSPQVLSARIREIFRVDVKSELVNCKIPMMYFRGEKDYVVPERNLKAILKLKPDIKIVEFNTSHFLLQSSPAEAWKAIVEFAQKLK
jgi:pimeloyl-[acyl-carrier protein] methyl ester esterase